MKIFRRESIQQNFANKLKRKDREVKQAGFIVLHQTFMPSVLVETGFLTNDDEGAYLNSGRGQMQMGTAIAEEIVNYKGGVQSGSSQVAGTISTPVPDPKEEVLVANKEGEGEQTTSSEDAAEQFAKNPGANPIAEKAPEKIPEPKEVVENVVEEVIETPKEEVIEIATDMNEAVVETAERMTEEAIPEKEDPVKQEVILANEVPKTAEVEKKEVPQPEVEVAVVEEEKKEEVATPAPPKGNNKGIVFKVQLMASTKEIALQSSNFGGLNKLSEERFNQFHRYMYGSTDSYTQAKLLKSNADAKGYPTSYIVAYRDGVRIPTPDAIKLVSE